MTGVEVNRSAPVLESAEIFIDAPIEAVWDVLVDFKRWPKWNSGVSRVLLAGPVVAGSSFVWVSGGAKIVCRLEQVDPPGRLVWSGRTRGIKALHAWELAPEDGGTRVRTEESFEGLLVKLLPGMMRKMLTRFLRQGVQDLKTVTESVG